MVETAAMTIEAREMGWAVLAALVITGSCALSEFPRCRWLRHQRES